MATQQFLQRFQRPPSPTLTNPDLILPDQGSAARLHTDIPAFRQRPPSPSQILRKANSRSQIGSSLYAQSQRSSNSLVNSSETRTPPLSRRSSNLDDRDELDTTPRQRSDYLTNAAPLRSSPTITDAQMLHANSFGAPPLNKRWSNASSSVRSEDFASLESLKWPGFESAQEDVDEDDGIELIDEDEEEQFGSFPDAASGPYTHGGSDARRRYDDDDDDDPYSPNALSRRADMILANAKKRLNLFEGNLNSARHSLPVAQSMSMASLRSPPDMPSLPTPPREKVNYAGLAGPIDSTNGGHGHGHSRGFSEASASSFIQQLLVARQQRKQPQNQPQSQQQQQQQQQQPPQRSVSALATHTQQNNQVRNSRSQEAMREQRIKSWVLGDASPAYSENAASREGIRRSPSTTNDLRAQMNELKGRISSLQQRAKDENLRRRSYVSVRSTSAASYRNSGTEMNRSQSSLRDYNTKTARSLDTADTYALDMPGGYADSHYDSEDDDAALARIDNESPAARAMLNETLSELEQHGGQFDGASAGDDESVYESVFEDDLGDASGAARHEDRPDAFDYENFFLHSAMGSYTRERSESVSSEDSVETTKPVAAAAAAAAGTSAAGAAEEDDDDDSDDDDLEGEIEEITPTQVDETVKAQSALHKRYASTESISTLATFMTATEGDDSDGDDGENTALDNALPQLASVTALAVPANANQRDSGVAMSPVKDDAEPSLLSNTVASDAQEDPLVPHEELTSQGLMLSSAGVSIDGNPLSLGADDQALLSALAQSLQKLCLSLRGHEEGQDEGAQLRRRLDDARRALDGLPIVPVDEASAAS